MERGEEVYGPGGHCWIEDALLERALRQYDYSRAPYDEELDGQTFGSRYSRLPKGVSNRLGEEVATN